MGTSPFFVSMLSMTLISSNHYCYQSKRQNVRKQVKRLMVQKSVSPVEVGSLSHCLQGLYIQPVVGLGISSIRNIRFLLVFGDLGLQVANAGRKDLEVGVGCVFWNIYTSDI